MKQKLLFTLSMIVALLFFGTAQLYGQTLNKPIPADNPNVAGNSPWDKACASASFNEYYVNFTWNPPLVNGTNEFILELSDATGDFSNAVELTRDGTKNVIFDFEFQFAVPADTRGENYRFRVRSTSPARTSPVSDPYPMYYIDIDSPITIRQQGQPDFGDGTAQVCNGNNISLEVYGVANPSTYQYNWYRSSTLIAGENGSEISISTAGMYNVEIDYGACSGSGNTLSNLIDVTVASSAGIAIIPPAKTALCAGETLNLEANINDGTLTYAWYKDGTLIPSTDNYIFTVDASSPGFEGDYQVEIFGPTNCLERSAAVTITNAGNFTVTRDNPVTVVVLPGQTQTLSVTTDAASPTYQWFRDGTPVGGETSSSITVDETETGVYFVRVSLSGGPCASTSIDSDSTTVVIPDSFEIIIDYATAYTACQNTDIVLEVNTINAIHSGGSTVDATADLQTSFSYQWTKDGTNVSGATSNTISLTGISENGDYEVDGTLSSYSATSNSLPVQLIVDETLTVSSSSLVYCNASEIIIVNTATDLTGESFEWQLDGSGINSTDTELQVTAPGTYRLVLDRNGCPLISNELIIAPLDPNLIVLDPSDNIVFPEGSSRTVSASGGDAYTWLDASNDVLSNTSSVTFTTDGTYFLLATIDNCELTREITVTYLDTFKVPNVITVNGDGINDQWIVPNSYSNRSDVNIIIYDANGQEMFNEFNYQNNWPQSSMSFPSQNMVFFYKIKTATEVLKQGTITIIR